MRLKLIALTAVCVIVAASLAMAEEKRPDGQMDMQARMETYEKLAAPGEPHKQLASKAGSWSTKTKAWMDPQPAAQGIDGLLRTEGAARRSLPTAAMHRHDDGHAVQGDWSDEL